MRRHFLWLILLFLLADALTSATVIHLARTESATIVVPDDFPTIQEAINNANSGDTVFVKAGTYYEHVIVSKTVSLVGADSSTTIIDGNKTESVVTITSTNVSMVGFTIRNSGSIIPNAGVKLDKAEQCKISENNIMSNEYGIYILESSFSTISGNNITDHHVGIEMRGSNGTEVFRNFLQTNYIGIGIINQANMNKLFDNIIANSEYCIYLVNCFSNALLRNKITNKSYSSAEPNFGIRIFSSSDNKLYGNSIKECNYGVFSEGQSNNWFWHNNFINNTNQATLTDSNVWDDGYPSGGNYWIDYTGIDLDLDGIGDAPHVIDGNNIDNYPLMGMFSDFNATSEHQVQIICNSTISDFEFNGTAISFNVAGENDTAGFCRTCIPKTLMNETYQIYFNGTEITYDLLPCSNETYDYLYFTYSHSVQEVIIIQELPSLLTLLLFTTTTMTAVFALKRKFKPV